MSMSMPRRGAHAAAERLMGSAPATSYGRGGGGPTRAASPVLVRSASAATSLYNTHNNNSSSSSSATLSGPARRPLSAPRSGAARPGSSGVRVESRPVTHQGKVNMHMPFQGPGLQILDKPYFIAKLRSKRQELQNEITTMVMEIERLEKRGPANFQLDQQQDALLQEVKHLKGTLGDYNMVMESVATGAELGQLQDKVKSSRENNDHARKKIAQLFTDRSQMERATKDAEQAYLSTLSELERQHGRDGLDKQAEFMEAMEENKSLNGEVERLESKLGELNVCIDPLEQDLEKMPPANQKKLMLVEQLLTSQEQLQRMQEKDASLALLPPNKAGDTSSSQIKDEIAKIAVAEAKSRELGNEIHLCEEKLLAVENDLNGLKGGRAEKFIEMQQKENKMQDFLDSYKAKIQENTIAKNVVEKNIEHLMERINQVEGSTSTTTSGDVIDNLGNSVNREQLAQELEIQREELKVLKHLESERIKEVEMTKKKVATLRNEITKWTNLDEISNACDSKCMELVVKKKAIEDERCAIQLQLKEKIALIEPLQEQLRGSPLHKNIETLHNEVLVLQQNVTRAQEELETKERESNYKPMLENIRFMVAQLNEEIRSKLKL